MSHLVMNHMQLVISSITFYRPIIVFFVNQLNYVLDLGPYRQQQDICRNYFTSFIGK